MRRLLQRFQRRVGQVARGTGQRASLLGYVDPRALLRSEQLLRLGTDYGGWLIPLDCGLERESLCYLAGAGEDITFDCALAARFHCSVTIIDPTPRAIRHFEDLKNAVEQGRRFPINNRAEEFYDIGSDDLARISFVPVGLGEHDAVLKFYLPKNAAHVSCSSVNLQKTEQYFEAQCFRLTTLMARRGDRLPDLLKMDIEGAEYGVIRDLLDSNALPRILLVEFDEVHTPLDGDADDRIGRHIRRLVEAGMRCVAIEGCNASFVRAR